jgi:glucose 1-dehydrogenase
MDPGITNRSALVSGAPHGIGRACALLFGAEDARVGITDRVQRDKGEALSKEIQNGGGDPIAVTGEVVRASGRID